MQFVICGVRTVEANRFAQRVRRIAYELQPSRELVKQSSGGSGARDPDQHRDRRLEDAVQGCIHGQFVETASEKIGADCESCQLTCDIEPAAHQLQILRTLPVVTRQTASNGDGQPDSEQADEQLQQVVPLRFQSRDLACSHAQFQRHGKHTHERRPNRAVVTVDLWQDLQGRSRRDQNADYLTRLEPVRGSSQNCGRIQSKSSGRAFRDPLKPSGVALLSVIGAHRQVLPLPDGLPGHFYSEACGLMSRSYAPSGKRSRTVQRWRCSSVSSSRPGGGLSRCRSTKSSPPPSTAWTFVQTS